MKAFETDYQKSVRQTKTNTKHYESLVSTKNQKRAKILRRVGQYAVVGAIGLIGLKAVADAAKASENPDDFLQRLAVAVHRPTGTRLLENK